MLRSIRSTAFLGTILLSGIAVAQAKKPAADDTPIESGKPGSPSATIPVPADQTEAPAAPAAEPTAPVAPVAIPAPPPPAPEVEPAAPTVQKKRTIESSGMNTQSTSKGGGADLGDSTSEKDWGFRFKGFFRAPMRIGIDASGSLTPNEMQYHSPPVVPDGNYTRWTYTNLNPGPWAELLFQYGNQRVMMTTSIASYNLTTGGWREMQDQLGIDRAFLTLKFPEALGNLGGMAFDVGIFQNAYGAAGKYDAGEYETYLIGRTRIAGVTATADMDVTDDLKLIFEGGGGAKVDQQYQTYSCTDKADTGTCKATWDYPSWMPYPGDKLQQGTNILLHVHAGAVINGILTAQLHYINSFVRDARWNVGTTGGASDGNNAYDLKFSQEVPGKGSIQVLGADAKLNGGWLGDGYVGVSYLIVNNPLVINDSIEVLHSQGGWQLDHNYFNGSTKGHILSIGGQYTFSLAGFMMRPRPFWGQGTDVTIRPFAMYNKVGGTTNDSDITKLKFGLDVTYSFMPMMAAAFRFDSVNPNMDNSHQSFFVFSPRLIFRSEFVTHEAVVLQYAYYKYGSEYTDPSTSTALMPWPYGAFGTLNIGSGGLNTQPDKHVITLYANMWW
jgi:hypothetical protein